jgi:hypothetical protein
MKTVKNREHITKCKCTGMFWYIESKEQVTWCKGKRERRVKNK